MLVYCLTRLQQPESVLALMFSRKSRYLANLSLLSMTMRSFTCLKLAYLLTTLLRMQGRIMRMKVLISWQLECREYGTMQLIWSGDWWSSIRKSVSMQMKLSPSGPRLVSQTILARFFLLMSWMQPWEESVVRKSVRRLASCIFFSCFQLTTASVWKCAHIFMIILCLPSAPIAIQMSLRCLFFSMMAIIFSTIQGSVQNLNALLQQVLSKIISSIFTEIPAVRSTISCFYWLPRNWGGNRMLFSLTIAYQYLKSPVKRMVPMQPRKRIIAAPGMCFASKRANSTTNLVSTMGSVQNLQQSQEKTFCSLGYLLSMYFLV